MRRRFNEIARYLVAPIVASLSACSYLEPPRTSAPDFRLSDKRGEIRTLESLKGDIVLLHFWATWCSTCKIEMNTLERVSRQLEGRGLQVVAVLVDSSENDFANAIRRWPSITHLRDIDRSAAGSYEVRGVPVTFVLAGDGTFALLRMPASGGERRSRWEGPQIWSAPIVLDYIQEAIDMYR